MAARKMKGAWWIDFRFEGRRIRRKSPVDNKRGAEEYERRVRQQLLDGEFDRPAVPTFSEWFEGRFWREWVIGRKNKPSEVESKRCIFENHLQPVFGDVPIDAIDDGKVARFRADLVERGLSEKRINNILVVLSKPLRYAVDVRELSHAPRIGLFKPERPEIQFWSFEEYGRLLEAARKEGPRLFAAVCLAGEAGLRVGEVKALRWREDVDLVAATITVSQQRRKGVTGTPKGRTRRTVPMTSRLHAALNGISTVRAGLILLHDDGSVPSDNQIQIVLYRICRRAGLPERQWHTLRHTFGTHAAMLGVNHWSLMTWMGHKRIDETMLYVHLAGAHRREIPSEVLAAGGTESDPDARVLRQLAARGHQMGTKNNGRLKIGGTTE